MYCKRVSLVVLLHKETNLEKKYIKRDNKSIWCLNLKFKHLNLWEKIIYIQKVKNYLILKAKAKKKTK